MTHEGRAVGVEAGLAVCVVLLVLLKKRKSKGAAEFSWSIINFQKDQDVRFKIGYEVVEKVPYLQIRENNWTLNADMNGRWNIRFDLFQSRHIFGGTDLDSVVEAETVIMSVQKQRQ
ncbi:outer envelope pore protein 21, chloroplastic isoform X2 [Manihot esculenta]|uniref:outer envelope pore protein 21, chloroplastic isoform X2 n=1 Tax=Manihot esculenta TaxID=3983 RepID=UPI000B5D4F72|nr:outer envelope pore protein 21, chloroplastic isoform X2 [Manihot esculenta]